MLNLLFFNKSKKDRDNIIFLLNKESSWARLSLPRETLLVISSLLQFVSLEIPSLDKRDSCNSAEE